MAGTRRSMRSTRWRFEMEFAAMVKLATMMLGRGEQIENALRVVSTLRQTLDAARNPPQPGDDDKSGGHKEGSVQWLQHSLNVLDNAGLAVDGDYGNATKAAVKKFQSEHGLAVDGWAGPQTVAAVLAELDKHENP